MKPLDPQAFSSSLLRWYGRYKRDLPWRNAADPYRIWISEIMLQQTRVAAVLGYYERFLQRFPTVDTLAAADDRDLLAAWSGLGYYTRARNLKKAAAQIVDWGGFPRDYASIRKLPGIGDYTAAALGSIAFGLPHAAVDGNVIRVLSRVTAEPGDVASATTRKRLNSLAQLVLAPQRPGESNQAMMELGATICLPGEPKCLLCPVADWCEARHLGRQREFPMKSGKPAKTEVEHRLLYIERRDQVLLWQRPADSRRMAGFWELPQSEQLPSARVIGVLGDFRHTIVNTNYRFEVAQASVNRVETGFSWIMKKTFHEIPLSTTSKKALACITK